MVKKINDKYPQVISGCMRFADFDRDGMNRYIHSAMELGINFFDHADIYGGGKSEEIFGQAMKDDSSLKREDMILQSKCGIRPSICYDLSKKYILTSVDNILKRLNTEYLDILLLHRPDALVEPQEVAEAFDELEKSGKVRAFGVSNHKPMQIELLKKSNALYDVVYECEDNVSALKGKADNCIKIAEIYLRMGNVGEARLYIEKALLYAEKHDTIPYGTQQHSILCGCAKYGYNATQSGKLAHPYGKLKEKIITLLKTNQVFDNIISEIES